MKAAAKTTAKNPSATPETPKDKPTAPAETKGTALAAQPTGAVVAQEEPNFAEDAGRGMEGATQESFAIPFLMVLQKGSPQVDEASGVALPGAKQGMFFLNISGKLMDGTKGVTVVPCAYRRVFLRWAPRSSGGGFRGEMLPDEVANLRATGKIVELENKLFFPLPDGTVNPDKCDRVADVRNHYVLLVNDDGSWTQALMSLGSTQIKKSKMLMSALADVKLKNGANQLYTPASWANLVKVTTVPEKNDKGSWMGLRFEVAGTVKRNDMYQAGKAFNESVRKGSVEVKYEDADAGGDPTTVDSEPQAGKGGGKF